MTKRTNRNYTAEFKQEAVALVTEQGYSVPKAAASLGITDKILKTWKLGVRSYLLLLFD
ncbi:transposase [Pseudoalteromonas sp. MSK9-3]|uniref:transposase n=1 Tax=Pseudoalteromonas sp. MSK9-3 TaxID=1897633 RepID=UPI000E6BCF83|nr:transposase [Pseudoalteromonas sp. MSK9-3]RJE76966.1 transposase [Pseudoalteromonas sp. MSK9-3]